MKTLAHHLTLGKNTFDNIFIQAPLAGISCAPFRVLSSTISAPAFNCTEMISCKTLLNKSLYAQQRFLVKHPLEGPLSYQLAGTDADEIAHATKIVTDYGADLIDLNCGCPVNKIRRKGAGSKLLANPRDLYHLIYAMKRHTHLPVSIKIRVDGDSKDDFNAQLVQVITDAGADFVTVHGRHWTEHYETPCRYDHIKYFVDNLKVPVIGNGDVKDLDTLKTMLATGCSGVMIGRAGVGQPWLIKKLKAEISSETFKEPTYSQCKQWLLEHVRGLIEILQQEKFAILQARKFAKYYVRNHPQRIHFMTDMNECENLSQLLRITDKYLGDSDAPEY